MALTPVDPVCAIDRIDGPVATGGFVELTGFAIDPGAGTPVSKIEIALDAKVFGETTLSGLRPDVSAHFSWPGYLWSGWSGSISLEGVSPGKHRVFVIAIGRAGQRSVCGAPEIDVLDVPRSAPAPPWRVAAVLLLRTLGFLLWLTLLGWAFARVLACRPVLLSAPLLGLALFAVASEAGSVLRVRPFFSSLFVTALSAAALMFLRRSGIVLFRGPSRAEIEILGCALIFLAIGILPLASHGEGAVLGDIDDAIRECSVADSISIYGWHDPPVPRAYLAAVHRDARGHRERDPNDRCSEPSAGHMRPGGPYLLSALGQAFGVRAHAVHSVAMLSTGVLIVLATGLLAFRVLRRFPERRWIAPALVAFNSTLLATLYGQHLGNLLAVALLLAFLSHALVLIRSPLFRSVWAVALIGAAALTLYPEATPVWGAIALLSLGIAGPGRRKRTFFRFAIAALLVAALNPLALVRATLFFTETTSRSLEMSSPYHRLMAGDTHYFPSLNVVTGLEAYREDVPAPRGKLRAVLILSVSVLILLMSLVGVARLAVSERWLVVALLLPVAVALAWTYRLTFPYGFAKFLPLAVPVWAMAFVLLASRAGERPAGSLFSARRFLSYAALTLAAALTLPATRHVFVRARRAIPSYDADFRVLPSLAAKLGRNVVIEIDEPLIARREWMRYFLGEHETELPGARSCQSPALRDRPRLLLLDRRRPDQVSKTAGPWTLDFALLPVARKVEATR